VTEGAREGTGIVHLVGAGPGDPGLLTVRGRLVLDRCDVVVHDALANPELLPDDAKRVFVGKRGGDTRSWKQEDINALLIDEARAGKRVVRLKGGDPFVFGRGSEEAQALAAAGIPFEVVPGITAGIGAAAYAGIPVTHRAVATSVTFVTGHEDPAKDAAQTDWGALARAGGTIVLYMGVKTLPGIAARLIDGGMAPDTPAAAIQWGTHPTQRTLVATLDTLAARAAAEGISAPVITVIGPVVELREEIAWFEQRPLFGRRVVVTRASADAGVLSEHLRELGAETILMPAIGIEPLDGAVLRDAIARLDEVDWVIFTSRNGVDLFWDALRGLGRDARALARVKLAAIGPGTSDALLARGLAVDVLPERFVAEGLLEALRERGDLDDARVMYIAAEGARDVLPAGLSELGATAHVIRAYRAIPDGAGAGSLRDRLTNGSVDLVTFTSASAVKAFVDVVGLEFAALAPAVTIGPVTSEAARDAGLTIALEAATSTIPGLVQAVVAASRQTRAR
jgi:uroporphyrinogen III methyltransferase/synthase